MTPSPSWHVRAEKLPTVFKPSTAFHSLHHGCRKQLSTTKRHTRCFQVRDYHASTIKGCLKPGYTGWRSLQHSMCVRERLHHWEIYAEENQGARKGYPTR